MSAEKVFNADISIHAPTRGATPCRQKKSSMQIFQSTLPRGERPSAERLGGVLWDFNPRSHEGSDLLWSGYRTKLRDISIHAPTRGATSISSVTDPVFIISIHAPTRGATVSYLSQQQHTEEFQSTLPRGERPSRTSYREFILTISIHAPTRGATWWRFNYA